MADNTTDEEAPAIGNRMAIAMITLHGPIREVGQDCPECGLPAPCPSREFAVAFLKNRFDELTPLDHYPALAEQDLVHTPAPVILRQVISPIRPGIPALPAATPSARQGHAETMDLMSPVEPRKGHGVLANQR